MPWLKTSRLRELIILIGGVALVRLFHADADRILRLMADGGGPTFTEREKRARTLAGFIRTLGKTLVVILAVMLGPREIGLDITPLLAGAGVAGVATGFGAQSLIKDAITGFFILLEDQFHVGDVIQAGGCDPRTPPAHQEPLRS